MPSRLDDAFAHNAWANRALVAYLRGIDSEALNASAVGAFGSILDTMKHMAGAESHYRFVLTGDWFDWGWDDTARASLDDIERWTGDLAAAWPAILDGVDAESYVRRTYPNGTVREVRAGVVLAQVLHHANVHREQVCSILTQQGLEAPDLDVWVYAKEHGLDREVEAP